MPRNPIQYNPGPLPKTLSQTDLQIRELEQKITLREHTLKDANREVEERRSVLAGNKLEMARLKQHRRLLQEPVRVQVVQFIADCLNSEVAEIAKHVHVTLSQVGPLGGKSSQVSLRYKGKQVKINVYSEEDSPDLAANVQSTPQASQVRTPRPDWAVERPDWADGYPY